MAERFEIEQIVDIFDADTEFIAKVGALTTAQKESLAELLIDNNSTIANSTARELATSSYLSTSIGGLGIPSSEDYLLQIYYTYKYAAIKLFFRQNYEKYVPEYDLYQIKRNDVQTESDKSKNQLLAEATMREFDRFSLIIDNISYTQDINRVPYEYLNYLAQVIGYQRDDYLLLTNATFRELLKNIIEIYKIKGSNYSFELFFNFLGFDITINEYWFDKRFGDPGISTNEYTGSVTKDSYLFYLTPIKPTNAIPDDMLYPYTVNENQITAPRNIKMFTQYTGWSDAGDSRGFTYQQLIGDTTGFTGDTYTWFKTNVIQYSLSSLGTEQEPELDADELERIEYYARFLSPVYVERQISVATAPYDEDISKELGLKFLDRADPIYKTQMAFPRSYYVRSIDANLGDTRNVGDSSYDDRAKVIVDDPGRKLYSWLHRSDYIYLTGDTTGDTSNLGNYFVAGDSYIERVITFIPTGWRYSEDDETGDSFVIIGDTYKSYDTLTSRTTVYLKGPLASARSAIKDGSTWVIGDTAEPYVRGGDTYLGTDQTTPGGYLYIGGPDTMMHLYQGQYPAKYYWDNPSLGDSWHTGFGDTRYFTAISGDSILSFGLFIGDSIIETHNFVSGMPVTTWTGDTSGDSLGNYIMTQRIVKEAGDTYIIVEPVLGAGDTLGYVFVDNRPFRGYFISGHHTDTHYAVYGDSINGDTNPISAYAVIKKSNPTWSEEQVFDRINYLESGDSLFDYEVKTYKVRPRELLVFVDAVRKNIGGDSTWSAGDPFTVGDTYLYRVGDSKERLYLGDTVCYKSSGDSIHGYISNTYVLISGNKHLISEVGDTYIVIAPWFEGGASGTVQKIPSWLKYTAVNLGDTNSTGDSIYDFHAGFINPVYHNSADYSETGPLTLGANFPITPEDLGRPIEVQELADRQRRDYWKISTGDSFRESYAFIGDSGPQISLITDNGDTYIKSLNTDKGFVSGDKLFGIDAEFVDARTMVQNGLVGFWPLDGNVKDHSTSNIDGTLIMGTGSYVSGKIGFGFKFDGTVSRLILGDTFDFNIYNGAVSFCWKTSAPVGDSECVFGRYKVGPTTLLFKIINNTIRYIKNFAFGTQLDFYLDATDVLDDQWHNIILAVDGIHNTVYFDAVDQFDNIIFVTGGETTFGAFLFDTFSKEPLEFGLIEILPNGFSGSLDDIRLYNRGLYSKGLTEVEAKELSDKSKGMFTGDSGIYASMTKYTDQRGLILSIDANAGIIQVYDPGDSGDSFFSEWANLCLDDYIMVYDANDDSNNGEYRVSSSTRTVPGDTTVITLGDSIIGGVDQLTSGGYISHVRKSKVVNITAVNTNGVGDILLHDTSRKFAWLETGDTIILEDTGDSNEGVYIVGDSILHYREGDGDTFGFTYFELGDSVDHDSGDSGGTIELNREYWTIGDSRHQSGFEFLEFIKMR